MCKKLNFWYWSFMTVGNRLFTFLLHFCISPVSYTLVSLPIKLSISFIFFIFMTTLCFLYTFSNNVHLPWIATQRTENKTAADTILMLNAAERLLHRFWNNLIHVLSLISSDKMLSGCYLKRKTCLIWVFGLFGF